MAKSLQEQLLQAGLADEKKARQIQQEKRKARKQKKPVDPDAEARREAAEKARLEKAEKDRQANRQRQEEQERQACRAQVVQIIEQHGLARTGGETPYQFVVGRKVHKLYVTAEQADRLARGRLAIVSLGPAFHILSPEAAAKVLERDPSVAVIRHEPAPGDQDEDDPYKDFQIPDDLMW